ncbi:MAG: hypothetical protein M1812_005810 [Candelaria pacifica]|nr:MAG: hypothetical protein M1812_005810 [Candelaria pacifica]
MVFSRTNHPPSVTSLPELPQLLKPHLERLYPRLLHGLPGGHVAHVWHFNLDEVSRGQVDGEPVETRTFRELVKHGDGTLPEVPFLANFHTPQCFPARRSDDEVGVEVIDAAKAYGVLWGGRALTVDEEVLNSAKLSDREVE